MYTNEYLYILSFHIETPTHTHTHTHRPTFPTPNTTCTGPINTSISIPLPGYLSRWLINSVSIDTINLHRTMHSYVHCQRFSLEIVTCTNVTVIQSTKMGLFRGYLRTIVTDIYTLLDCMHCISLLNLFFYYKSLYKKWLELYYTAPHYSFLYCIALLSATLNYNENRPVPNLFSLK